MCSAKIDGIPIVFFGFGVVRMIDGKRDVNWRRPVSAPVRQFDPKVSGIRSAVFDHLVTGQPVLSGSGDHRHFAHAASVDS